MSSETLRFYKVLLDVSNQLSADHLDQLKYLVRDSVGKRDLEKIQDGRQLFRVLEERGLLAADSTEFLAELLRHVHRHDLSDKLRLFSEHREAEDPVEPPQPPEPERARLDAAALVVGESLGRSWRRLGRRLGVSEVKLESIARKHPSDLEETAMELLKEWRRSQGAAARAEELIAALRSCQFNLTADNVEDRLTELGLS